MSVKVAKGKKSVEQKLFDRTEEVVKVGKEWTKKIYIIINDHLNTRYRTGGRGIIYLIISNNNHKYLLVLLLTCLYKMGL